MRFLFQTADYLGKYLWHSNPGLNVRPDDVWKNFFDTDCVDSWYDKLVDSGLSGSTVFNCLVAVRLGSDYAFTKLRMIVPNGFNEHLERLKSKEGRRKKTDEQTLLENQSLDGLPDLQPLVDAIKSREMSQRFSRVFDTCTEIIAGNSNRDLSKRDFLFAMRLVLVYVVCSMGLRASAIYTLRLVDVNGSDYVGIRSGERPVLFRNKQFHKTFASHGRARIVLSGQGKTFFHMYIAAIRPVYVKSQGFECPNVFLDSTGNELSSSAVNRHLKVIVSGLELPVHYNTTYIRKCIRTQLKTGRSATNNTGAFENALAAGLLHSDDVSRRHYSLGERDRVALHLHNAIVTKYRL